MHTIAGLRVSDAEGIREIRFDRPEKKNALTQAMYAGLVDALDDALASDGVRAVLVTGGTACFTAGNDIADFAGGSLGPDAPVRRFVDRVTRFDKPLVAAVAGAAVGVGTTMLLHCDAVVAHAGAVLVTPFVDLGIVPEAGSSLLVPQLVGHARAARLLLLGEPLPAAEAHAWGIVTEVVGDVAEVEPRARALAARFAAKPPQAMRAAKRLMRPPGLRERVDDEHAAFAERLASPEAQAAFARFLTRRG